MSAWKGEWENVVSGKHMESVQEETLAVLATEVIVDNEHNRSLLLRRRRHRLAKEDLRKAKPPRESSPSRKKSQRPCKNTAKEIVRIRRVIIGILPYVTITNLYRDVNAATNVCVDTPILMASPVKSRRKAMEKDQLPHWRSPYNWVACPKIPCLRGSLFYGKLDIGIDSHRHVLPRHMAHKKFGKGSIAKDLCKSVNLKHAICVRQNLRIGHFRKPCNKNDASRREAWDLAKNVF